MWLLASGALSAMKNSQSTQWVSKLYSSYWDIVNDYNKQFPNPNEHQIEVDLERTFSGEDDYGCEDMINKLRRVCLAYTIRNPEVGYC